MSYWDECEKIEGEYSFLELDEQINVISSFGAVATLCIGARQPRWPESHWPAWSLKLSRDARYQALYSFIETVLKRYENQNCIISYQLENEALNRSFGTNGDFNRDRLVEEFKIIKQLANKDIIMSTSNIWGIPIRSPRPDKFGFTLYQTQFEDGVYSHNKIPIWWWSLRAKIIKYLTNRDSFIHELQAEPWGPRAIWEMSNEEQDKSMNLDQLIKNIELAKQTNLYPIDLWGGEWWHWRHLQGDDRFADIVKKQLSTKVISSYD